MSEDAFNARFTRLENNIDRITEALVKIAEIDGRQATIQEMITQQNKVILKLGDDVSEGLKRAHDRIDAMGVRISGADGFVQNATPKITELKQDLKKRARRYFVTSKMAHLHCRRNGGGVCVGWYDHLDGTLHPERARRGF